MFSGDWTVFSRGFILLDDLVGQNLKELYKKGGTQYDKKLDCKAFVQPVDVHCLCCLTQTTQIQRPDSKGMPSIKGAPKSCRLQPLNSLYSAEL